MISYIRNILIRILLAEDTEPLLTDCADFIKRWFPAAQIDTATTVSEAQTLMNSATAWSYDAAILDLKMPPAPGEHAVPSAQLALSFIKGELAKQMGQSCSFLPTHVAQWTAFPEDPSIPGIIEESKRQHEARDYPCSRYEVISKQDQDWPEQILRFLDTMIAERKIAYWLDDPYFRRMRSGIIAPRVRQSRMGGPPVSISRLVDALISDEVWPLLSEERKEQMFKTFEHSRWACKRLNDGRAMPVRPEWQQNLREAERSYTAQQELLAKLKTDPGYWDKLTSAGGTEGDGI